MSKITKISVLLLFTITFSITVFSQTAAQIKLQRQKDVQSVANMQDFGFDGAVVTKTASVRETAAIKGKVLLAVKRGDILSLVARDAVKNWYNVVDEKSGVEGWIDGNAVVIKLTTNTETGPPLREEESNTNLDPEVSISNGEEKTALRIRINGTLYVVPPQTTKVITVKAGKFSYYGWSPGIRPTTGSKTLEKGKKYSWFFKINRR